jgi:hypothetical protein
MPSIVGAFKIVANNGAVNNGDSVFISPNSSTKEYNGSGSVITGDLAMSNTLFSITNVNDPDVVDDSVNKAGTVS